MNKETDRTIQVYFATDDVEINHNGMIEISFIENTDELLKKTKI